MNIYYIRFKLNSQDTQRVMEISANNLTEALDLVMQKIVVLFNLRHKFERDSVILDGSQADNKYYD